ncbi:hypothetical protein D9619_007845 [Psilocybe cf. subviscida]|uniref:DUF221-domain-containing protein n=1 Tax=Psilocybe cf. subviscida TaxID=2480587 RepID=A0A8H5ES96_9AGAR|nr:hypothetical protein D9619_007845 [Psilocybe cf. subviscida]
MFLAGEGSTTQQQATSASTPTFVTALVFNAIVFAAEIAVFTLIRPYFKSIYEPRTYTTTDPKKRQKPLSQSMFMWPLALFNADYRKIIAINGLDAYFFVRFLRVMAITLLPIWLVSWVVLLPITSVKTSVPSLSGLDRFTYGNVAPNKQARYAAHLILAYFFTFWIFYVIKKEMRHFIVMRQKHLIDRTHAQSVQASTILITGIPKKYLTQDALFKVFNALPGGVKRIWINRSLHSHSIRFRAQLHLLDDLKELPELYDRRLAACAKLESAETALLRTAAKLRLKADKEAGKGAARPESPAHDTEANAHPSAVPADQRPTHKLGFLGLFGEKVDSIDWAREEIATCSQLLEEKRALIGDHDERGESAPEVVLDDGSGEDDVVVGQSSESTSHEDGETEEDGLRRRRAHQNPLAAARGAATGAVKGVKGVAGGVATGAELVKGRVGLGSKVEGSYPALNSAFVTFNKQISAHLAVQVLTHHEPYRMSNRYVEVSPVDVIWANLGLNPYEQKIRIAISYAATAALIIFWALPVAFVGVISNIHTVCTKASWLAWICTLPKIVIGIISGILPPVLLAVLMMLLPIVLRLLARFEGIPKYTGLELSLMTRFFIFQVVHSFLVVTLSSGIISSLTDLLNNPTSIPNILAQNLPKASTFFLTYMVLQGLTGTAGGFLQIVKLIIYYVKLIILGSTPRSVWGIKYQPGQVAWGTLFPNITLLVVITLGYSIISPIINGLACATFFAFYQLYKYLFLYVYQQPSTTDTGGLFYPKALQHIFVGLYVEQVCLCALFFLARNENNNPSAIPEGALMIVLIIITAGFNIIIKNSYGPLITALPLSLQDRTYTPTGETDGQGSPAQAPAVPSKERHSGESAEDIEERKKVKAAAEDAEEGDIHEEQYGFAHPAVSRPQRRVWIPRDTLGLAEEEARACREAGIKIEDHNATMNEKGKVDVHGGPPDMIGIVA